MNNTKIDWADSTWNPITGCLHDCEYCYARGIAHRFSGAGYELCGLDMAGHDLVELDEPYIWTDEYNVEHKITYPAGFTPTFHRYRLYEPAKKKKPQTIFVGSMCDLFGEWVPDEWIESVFNACAAAPQHRYLFLTKNPWRYKRLKEKGVLPYGDNYWFGSTATTREMPFWWSKNHNAFVSIEPMLGPLDCTDYDYYTPVKKVDWVILGAETGNRKGKVIPRREWIENVAKDCHKVGTAVFMKESLRGLMGDDFVQEFPWGNRKRDEK